MLELGFEPSFSVILRIHTHTHSHTLSNVSPANPGMGSHSLVDITGQLGPGFEQFHELQEPSPATCEPRSLQTASIFGRFAPHRSTPCLPP